MSRPHITSFGLNDWDVTCRWPERTLADPEEPSERLIGVYLERGEMGAKDGARQLIRRARSFVLVGIDMDPDVDEIHYSGDAVATLTRAVESLQAALDAARKATAT